MNKPDWKAAPEWASYLAMDADGRWFWYEYAPSYLRSTWDMWTELWVWTKHWDGRVCYAGKLALDEVSASSLEARPHRPEGGS